MRTTAAVGLLAAWYFALGVFLPSAISFQFDSERLLLDSAAENVRGFMIQRDGESHVVYYSQYGLHSRLYTVIARTGVLAPKRLFRAVQLVTATLLAVVLVAFCGRIQRDHGRQAALVVYLLIFASYPLALFATKLYWQSWLALAPMTLTLWAYPSQRRLSLLVALALLVCVKSLCGYEYLSCITLSIVVAVLYHELARGTPLRRALRRSTLPFAAGCAGFAVAFAIHYAEARHNLGDAAWKAITRSARLRIGGDAMNQPISLKNDLLAFAEYFFIHGQSFLLAVAIIVLRLSVSLRYWITLLLAAMVASLSWNVLTPGHMRYHLHINIITFYIPLNLMIYAMIGVTLTHRKSVTSPPAGYSPSDC